MIGAKSVVEPGGVTWLAAKALVIAILFQSITGFCPMAVPNAARTTKPIESRRLLIFIDPPGLSRCRMVKIRFRLSLEQAQIGSKTRQVLKKISIWEGGLALL